MKKSPFISEPKFSDFCLKFIDFRQKSPLISAMKKIFFVRICGFLAKNPNDLWGPKITKNSFFPKNHGFLATISNDLWGSKIDKKNFFRRNPHLFPNRNLVIFVSNSSISDRNHHWFRQWKKTFFGQNLWNFREKPQWFMRAKNHQKKFFSRKIMDFWQQSPMIYGGKKLPKKNFFPENTRFSQELTIYFPSNKKSKKIHDFHSIGEQLTPPLISSLKRFLKFFFATIVKTLKNTTFGFEGGETFKIKFWEFSLIWGFSKKMTVSLGVKNEFLVILQRLEKRVNTNSKRVVRRRPTAKWTPVLRSQILMIFRDF